VVQDSSNQIWSATEEGVLRYNSTETFLYHKYNGLPAGVADRVYTIFIDSKQHIWIALEGGIAYYEAATDSFAWLNSYKEAEISSVTSIVETSDNQLWFGGYNGLWRYDTEKKEIKLVSREVRVRSLYVDDGQLLVGAVDGFYTTSPDGQLRSPNENINTVPYNITAITRHNDTYLLGTNRNGLLRLSSDFSQIELVDLKPYTQRNYRIRDLVVTPNGQIYVATDGAGFLLLDQNLKLVEKYSYDVNNPNSVSSDGIYDILIGKENMLWVATYGGGLSYLNLSEQYFKNITHRINDPNSIVQNFTRSILETDDGRVWFGTKRGISIWNPRTSNWKNIPYLNPQKQVNEIVMALAETKNHVWAGTYGSGAFRIDKNTLVSTPFGKNSPAAQRINLDRIYAIAVDAADNVWLGGIDEELQQIAIDGTITAYPIKLVKDIIPSQQGGVVVVGKNGVHRIKNRVVVEINTLQSGQHGLTYSTLNCIAENSVGNLTIGTNGDGIIFYDNQRETFQRFDFKDGLPADIVQGLIYADPQTLWVSTTRGLAVLSLGTADTTIQVFDKSDGLASMEFNYGSYAQLSTDELAFGGVDGVTLVEPQAVQQQLTTPKIILENIEVLNIKPDETSSTLPANLQTADRIQLKHYENALRIKYAGILHSNPERVQYSWRMRGLDDDWSEPTTERQINFTNLSPGKYNFEVKAANRGGEWTVPKAVQFSINPPWYATNTAYGFYLLLLIGLVI
ncbi:MAG: two-component regulator propeller domain-containing protein, partial [Saprospiraceae bacterium]